MPRKVERRHVVKWRRRKLPDGGYLQIAVTKEAGPKGGHTIAYPLKSKGETVYPAREDVKPRRVVHRKRKHGRQVRVRHG